MLHASRTRATPALVSGLGLLAIAGAWSHALTMPPGFAPIEMADDGKPGDYTTPPTRPDNPSGRPPEEPPIDKVRGGLGDSSPKRGAAA